MTEKRRIYNPRIVVGRVMQQDDFERLHKYLREAPYIHHISDDLRVVIESEWPELVCKLPPKTPQK
jgi:hypothetical protein